MERSRADGLLFRNPTTDMSSAATTNVKTAVPIFNGSNYNIWVDQMKFWLQSQNLWRIVNGAIPQPTVGPGPPQSLPKMWLSGTTRMRLPLAPYPFGLPTICGLPFLRRPILLQHWCGQPSQPRGLRLAFLPYTRTTRPLLRLQTIKTIVNSRRFEGSSSDEPRRVQVLDLYCLTRFESEGSGRGDVY